MGVKADVASTAFRKLNEKAGAKIGKEKGFINNTLRSIHRQANESVGVRGAVYGGAAGAAGGIVSNDKDMHWYSGGAMGALAGMQVSKRGLSGGGITGGILGGVYGMAADDTSIMGGAFMGALGGGAGIRYAKRGLRAMGKAKTLGTKGPKGEKVNFSRRLAFGANAVSQAINKDLGLGWRGQGAKRGLKSNKPDGRRLGKVPENLGGNYGGGTKKQMINKMRDMHKGSLPLSMKEGLNKSPTSLAPLANQGFPAPGWGSGLSGIPGR